MVTFINPILKFMICLFLVCSYGLTANAQLHIVDPVSINTICMGTYYWGPTEDLTTIRIAETNPGDIPAGMGMVYFSILTTPPTYNGVYYFDHGVGTVTLSSGGNLSFTQPYGVSASFGPSIYFLASGTDQLDTITIAGLKVRSSDAGDGSPSELVYSANMSSGLILHHLTPVVTFYSTVNPEPTIAFTPDFYYCNGQNENHLLSGIPAGGVWTGSGVEGAYFNPLGLSAGNKILTYTVQNGGSCSRSSTVTATVLATPLVSLTCDAPDYTICTGESVTFTGAVSGSNQRFQFYKNDLPVTTLSAVPAYTTASLMDGDRIYVVADNGNQTCADTSETITIMVGEHPEPRFNWQNVCGQNQVTFQDISQLSGNGTIVNRQWDFTNDGNFDHAQASALPNLTHGFSQVGEYFVRLGVTTDRGCYEEYVQRVYTLPGIIPTASEPYAVNFASSPEGWACDGKNSSWGWGAGHESFGQGSRNFWSTGQTNGDKLYSTDEQSYLYGPCVNLSELDKPMIAIKLSSRMGGGLPAGAILEATDDEGLNWRKVGSVIEGLNWYNNVGIVSTPSSTLANTTTNNPLSEGWAGVIPFDNETMSRLSLQPYYGSTSVRLRINFESVADAGAPLYAGIGIDSVWIGNRTRRVLLEHFTNNEGGGFVCNPGFSNPAFRCSASNDSVNKIHLLRINDVNSIHYHTSFPGVDNFNALYPIGASAKVLYYGLSSAPRTYINGGAMYNRYGDSFGELNLKVIDSEILEPSKFDVDLSVYMENMKITAATRVKYTGETNFNSDVVVHIVVLEENKIDNGINYKYVLRQMLPDASGNYISRLWQKNDQVELANSWIFSDGNIGEAGVLVFIQDKVSKKVYQTIYVKGEGSTGEPVIAFVNRERNSLEDVLLFPNPANEEFTMIFNFNERKSIEWELMDVLGKLFDSGIEENKQSFTVSLRNIPSGLYTIRLKSEKGEQMVKRIIVSH